MNSCRNCRKPIPNRLCFCTTCTEQLTSEERLDLMRPQELSAREETVARILSRLNGRPERVSVPPPKTGAAAAFREARRILAPILGRKT